jgi:hypothetical protein
MKLYPPRPEVPIDKLNFRGLCEMLRSTQSPTWYGSPRGFGRHSCNLNTTVVEIVDAAIAGAIGLAFVISDSSDIFSL